MLTNAFNVSKRKSGVRIAAKMLSVVNRQRQHEELLDRELLYSVQHADQLLP